MKLNKGKLNLITDVDGVRVGHSTLCEGDIQTGVTVVLPSEDNPFVNKLVAASFVINGFGKTSGLVQINELGQLESPIALTNTLSVGCVQEALVGYMIDRCETESVPIKTLNVVVGECNDSGLNAITKQAVRKEHVREAIDSARVEFEQGAVGGGRGMVCHGLKGGIGSASRSFELCGTTYTLGVLVQANHGLLGDLIYKGKPIGEELLAFTMKPPVVPHEEGSIIIIIATDLPLDARQLNRLCKRSGVGLARVGSYLGNGSGDIAIAFSTANRQMNAHDYPKGIDDPMLFGSQTTFNEWAMDLPFKAVGEATEEAILNALRFAKTVGEVESLSSLVERMGGDGIVQD